MLARVSKNSVLCLQAIGLCPPFDPTNKNLNVLKIGSCEIELFFEELFIQGNFVFDKCREISFQ